MGLRSFKDGERKEAEGILNGMERLLAQVYIRAEWKMSQSARSYRHSEFVGEGELQLVYFILK